jgi:hypothetical protein
MRSAKLTSLIFLFLLSPAVALSAKDPSDYPLRVVIVWNHWEVFNVPTGSTALPTFVHKVNGRGNVTEGSTVHAFDFEYRGSLNIASAPLDRTYFARWKKPQQALEILMPAIGHEGRYTPCTLETLVRPGVYVHSSQGVIEKSQDDYKIWQAQQNAPKPPPPPPQGQPATVSKLSVSSNPDSAEINVDGEFMGTTPSVLQLNVGEHLIALHKAGYALWQRKMKVVAGDINLNADLEPEKPK